MTTTAQPAPVSKPVPATKGKPLYIDIEKGRRSVLGYIQSGKVDLRACNSFEEVEKVVLGLVAQVKWDVKGVPQWTGKNPAPTAIIFDSISKLAKITLQDVTLENPSSLWANRTRLAASTPGYGQLGNLLLRLMRFARALNIPLILTAGERIRENQVTGATTYFPDFTPEILSGFMHDCDTVLRLSRTAGTRVARLQPDDNYYAKIRVPDNLPPAPDIVSNPKDKTDWTETIKRLDTITGGIFAPLDESGEISPVLLYGTAGVGKTRLAVELALSL